MVSLRIVISISVFLFTFASSYSQNIPQLIYYQGNLADASGNPVNTSHDMTFSIWKHVNSANTSDLLWQEAHSSVPVNNGLFTVTLGSQNPISADVFANKTCYLQIKIANEILSPRQQIMSMPYAYAANSVAGESNTLPSNGKAGIGTNEPVTKLHIKDTSDDDYRMLTLECKDGNNTTIGVNALNELQVIPPANGVAFRNHQDTKSNVVFHSNGNVGIGKDTPTEKLQVEGVVHSSTGGFKFPDGSVQATAASGGNGSNDNLGNHTATQNIKMNGNWLSGDGRDKGVYVQENGNVGVGTANPSAFLHIQTDGANDTEKLKFSGEDALIGLGIGDRGPHGLLFGDDDNDGMALVYRSDPNAIYIEDKNTPGQINGNKLVTVTRTGNVGIGVTNPAASLKLDVNGNAQISGRLHLNQGEIDAFEILNEPGIAREHGEDGELGPLRSGVDYQMQDMVTLSITIPASGYIMVSGRCHIYSIGGNPWGDLSQTILQIDQTQGGKMEAPHFIWDRYELKAGVGYSMNVERVYYMSSAGSYTFRMEGTKLSVAVNKVEYENPTLTAIYYPTSYGAVETVAASASGIPDEKSITVKQHDGSQEIRYKIDLRYYEIQALKASKAAEKAELEFLAAQMQQQLQPGR